MGGSRRSPALGSHPGRDIWAERPWPCGSIVKAGWSPQEPPAATASSVQLLQPRRGLIDGLDKPAGGTCSGESSPDQTLSRWEAWPQHLQLGSTARAAASLALRKLLLSRKHSFCSSHPQTGFPHQTCVLCSGRRGEREQDPTMVGVAAGSLFS